MPNIENLGKQAKLDLRWHRERYFSIAAQIRSFLARFRDLPDKAVLSTDFMCTRVPNALAQPTMG